ncbi:dienelactone hydrolase family protein [Hymenobacter cellulosilyticus]|uniref:dienelactone hydrolase family protein n=1 Tax=Hymenobacter cellulosilyticus TaxID=2932248 RepID=UPI0021D47F2A|nr:dienelactone hydrolase family protein [Hymenobacter cellulosilyticus]
MDQRIINLFDEYTHKPLTRMEFMERLVKLTGGLALAMTALSVLDPGYAEAATIEESDKDLVIEEVSWPGDASTMKGYLARPKGRKKRGAVVVIHENRGLTPHIKDVTRRVAKAGYLALG